MRVELGCPGHLIVAYRCRWRRHTQVGDFRISTVGDLYVHEEKTPQTLSGKERDYFQTAVFRTGGVDDCNDGCGCHKVLEWNEVEIDHYATAGAAQQGHEAMVKKYLDMER